ncbi:MAG TPA: c-type cytochrome [Caulobacteraceae bacterium]|jgi:cytochrome c
MIGVRTSWLAAAFGGGLLLAGCGQQPGAPAWKDFGGDAARGAVTIDRTACGACHEIPGIANATGLVGPPLKHFARRTVIAGMLPNTPPNLVDWIRYPQSVAPGNAMPNEGLTDAQSRDVAAYLYTLK